MNTAKVEMKILNHRGGTTYEALGYHKVTYILLAVRGTNPFLLSHELLFSCRVLTSYYEPVAAMSDSANIGLWRVHNVIVSPARKV